MQARRARELEVVLVSRRHGVPHAVVLDPEPRTGPVLESPGASAERAGEHHAELGTVTLESSALQSRYSTGK